MGIKKDYMTQSVNTILKLYPHLEKTRVEEFVTSKIKETLTNPTVKMDNNITGEHEKITLTELCNWINTKKPVVSGNATFYMQPTVLESPSAKMLRSLKFNRSVIKSEMFKYEYTTNEYKQLNLQNINSKVLMNADFGASGSPFAAFYTKYSPSATTLMAQSIITVMAAFFEGYIGDNNKFFHINECIDWMNKVINKKESIPNWIFIPTPEVVIDRISKQFIMNNDSDIKIITNYIQNCSSMELVYLYYANNIKEFIKNHNKISMLIKNILTKLPLHEAVVDTVPDNQCNKFSTVKDYNNWVSKEMFLNPYSVPDIIKEDMETLTKLMTKFCYIEYLTPDSIMKLNNHIRKTVLLVDTDSNIIFTDDLVCFILDEIFPNETFSRDRLYNDMICVNILASILDDAVKKLLDFYGRVRNMDENSRKEFTMKNEFLFRIFFLMNKKKRYAASIVLQEGNMMMPFKLEIKGVDFIKSSVTKEVTERFTKIIKDYILFSDDLKLRELKQELKLFEKEIYNDLKNGGVRFLKPKTYKAENAYKTSFNEDTGITRGAWSLPVFRAAEIWNLLDPTKKIFSLDKVKIIKLIVTKPEDMEVIKVKYPKEYEMVMSKIFNSPNKDIVKAGLKVIALPSTVKEIPEWIIPLIDYDIIISNVVSSFKSVIDALRIESFNMKTRGGDKAYVVSSLISI